MILMTSDHLLVQFGPPSNTSSLAGIKHGLEQTAFQALWVLLRNPQTGFLIWLPKAIRYMFIHIFGTSFSNVLDKMLLAEKAGVESSGKHIGIKQVRMMRKYVDGTVYSISLLGAALCM